MNSERASLFSKFTKSGVDQIKPNNFSLFKFSSSRIQTAVWPSVMFFFPHTSEGIVLDVNNSVHCFKTVHSGILETCSFSALVGWHAPKFTKNVSSTVCSKKKKQSDTWLGAKVPLRVTYTQIHAEK